MSEEQQIENNLFEIFQFYSRQHFRQGLAFEELEDSMKKMDLGEFTKFCKDFSINLHKVKLTEIFRKIQPHYLEHK